MNSAAAPQKQEELFGLFELDEDGSVLYSSLEESFGALIPHQDISGRAFFSEVAPFSNRDELRGRFQAFQFESLQAASFDFICEYAFGSVPVKVLVARLGNGTSATGKQSFLLHIRKK